MNIDYSPEELEKIIADSAPQPFATEGLKLQIMREAHRDKHRRQARRQIFGAVASCLLLFFITEVSMQTVSRASQQIASGLNLEPTPLRLCQLELHGDGIGSWDHVEAVMKYHTQVRGMLRPLASTSSIASL